MKVILKEKTPMFGKHEKFEIKKIVWYEPNEVFEVVDKKLMFDGKWWFKIRLKWLIEPLHGWFNPDLFELETEIDKESKGVEE